MAVLTPLLICIFFYFWLTIISIIYTVNGTEWPYMCWCAVKQLLTHSLTLVVNVRCQIRHTVVRASVPRMQLPLMKWLNADCHEGKSWGGGYRASACPVCRARYCFTNSVCPTVRLSVKCRYWSVITQPTVTKRWRISEGTAYLLTEDISPDRTV